MSKKNSILTRNILVIDDELARGDQGTVFSSDFAVEGFQYFFAADEREAIQLFDRGEEFALVLLDMRFEGYGHRHGLDILDMLLSVNGMPPVVIMSSLSEPETILESWRSGAATYLVKWGKNPDFYAELKNILDELSLDRVGLRRRVQSEIRNRTTKLLQKHKTLGLDEVINQARNFKEDLGLEFKHSIPFPADYENYIRGWNASEAELQQAERDGQLLYINMDLGTGCTLNCPHCFTMNGKIDRRGRTFMNYERLKERILEAKDLGLKAVRILGRGEPTQWIAWGRDPNTTGGDFLDFITFLSSNGIIPLVFTRGQIIANEKAMKRFYRSKDGVVTGKDLLERLYDLGASIFLGVSSMFPEVNNELVGRGKKGDYDPLCRSALKMAVEAGFTEWNPTRLAVESPITTLNIMEMPVRYLLFQMLNISPCMNVYMVAGRMPALGLDKISDPSQSDFMEMYSMVAFFMRRLGIKDKLGPYAGTKECHDVSNGLYLTLNGDVYPCPGYEDVQSFVGSLQTHSVKEIWENSSFGRRPQSICPPKIASHFPPDFEKQVESMMVENGSRYSDTFDRICQGLGISL